MKQSMALRTHTTHENVIACYAGKNSIGALLFYRKFAINGKFIEFDSTDTRGGLFTHQNEV